MWEMRAGIVIPHNGLVTSKVVGLLRAQASQTVRSKRLLALPDQRRYKSRTTAFLEFYTELVFVVSMQEKDNRYNNIRICIKISTACTLIGKSNVAPG